MEIDDINDALDWMHRQRHNNVPVYNQARLNERPLPNINQPNDVAPEQNDDGVENDAEIFQPVVVLNQIEFVQANQQGFENDDRNGDDGLVVAQENQNFVEIDDLLRPEVAENAENRPNETEPEIENGVHYESVEADPLLVLKDEVFEPVNDENIEDDLIDLFAETMIPDEHIDYFGSDNECEISWNGPIAAPMRFDAKINDPISGNRCFTVVVSIATKRKLCTFV